MVCTIFKDTYSKEPIYIQAKDALKRIQTGRSEKKISEIRTSLDAEKISKLKEYLPAVCFSGTFQKDRKDKDLIQHSGLIVLDFDKVDNLHERQIDIVSLPFVYACWVSPSGKGLKVLIKIADSSKHREHFEALKEVFPDMDFSTANEARLCYESYDPDIYINEYSEIFATVKVTEKVYVKEDMTDESEIFKNILIWLSNQSKAFTAGERNNFIFILASACCRYGIGRQSAISLIGNEFLVNSDFTSHEAERAIKSAYRATKPDTAFFEKGILVDRITKKKIEIPEVIYDESLRVKDVIYGIDVKQLALSIFDNGYEKVYGIGVEELDYLFKPKRGELTVLTGYGNAGKSIFKRWYQVMRAILYNEKFATFSPEDNPAEEYYHDLVEILLSCDCTPANPHKPDKKTYDKAYDWIRERFFYLMPKETQATPDYIKERFLQLIIKEKINGVDIDPFNKLSNNYKDFSGRDKYLEYLLADFSRFAQQNNVYFWIIAHPKTAVKDSKGNYPCPDVFDIADGAMWNNMSDNILVYHRPFPQVPDVRNQSCEFHSKKIRRQKCVGKRGLIEFQMLFSKRRFLFNSLDPMAKLMHDKELSFGKIQTPDKPKNPGMWTSYKNDNGEEVEF